MLTTTLFRHKPQQAVASSLRQEKKKRRAYTLTSLIEDLEKSDFSIFTPEIFLRAFGWAGSTITLQGQAGPFKLLPALLERKAYHAVRVLIQQCRIKTADSSAALLTVCRQASEDPEEMLSLAHLLFEYGASCNATDSQGRTALHIAYESTACLPLLSLVASHANVNAVNHDGDAVLHHALRADNHDAVVLLMHNGAHANSCDGNGRSPIVLAAQHGSDDTCLRELRLFGASLDLVNAATEEATALLKCPRTALPLLQRGGMRVNEPQNATGVTPLHTMFGDWCGWATSTSPQQLQALLFPTQGDKSSLVQALLANISDINVVDKEGRTPLHYACSVRHPTTAAFCQALVSQGGADCNARDNIHGWTPLHTAMASGNYATAVVLLQQGASLDLVDALGRTPVHVIDHQREPKDDVVCEDDRVTTATALVDICLQRGFDFCRRDNTGNLSFFSVTTDALHFAMIQAAASQGLFR